MRLRPRLLPAVVALVAVLGVAGCSGTADTAAAAGYRPLPTSGVPDYQLGGAYAPPAGVTVVERDSTERPAKGTYDICYVNGFQTQPDEADTWKRRYPSAVLRTASGRPVSDPGWPDEMLLDTRTAAKRAVIAEVVGKAVARCGSRGFEAVEFDNLDSWTRSKGALTRAGNLALAKSLVAAAHRNGLAAAQKNTPQLGTSGKRGAGFDFAVAEECVQYRECSAYTDVYGERVVDVEYADTLKPTWASVCAMQDRPTMTILRDRDLVLKGDPAYVFRHC